MNDIKKLTDNQLIAKVFNGNNGIMKDSLQLALNGIFDIKADRRETLQLVKQALNENKTFCCAFDNAECINDRPCNVPKAKLKLWIEDCELTNAYAGVHSKTIFDFCDDTLLDDIALMDKETYLAELKENPIMNAHDLIRLAEIAKNWKLETAVYSQYRSELEQYFNE